MHSRGFMKHRLPQLRSKRLGSARVSASNGDSAAFSSYRSLVAHLLKTRPVVFWGGVWTSIFLVSLVAVGCLLSPSASSNRTASAIVPDAEPAVETAPTHREGQAPVWMFGAIALTCVVGSLLVAQYLKPSPATKSKGNKRASKSLKLGTKLVSKSQPQYPEPSKQLQPFSPTAPLPFPVLLTFVQSSPEPVVLIPADQKEDQRVTQQQSLPEQATYDLISWLNSELEHPSYCLENPLDPFTASGNSVNHEQQPENRLKNLFLESL